MFRPDSLRAVIGELNSFAWGNPNAELVAWYVASSTVDPLVAERLCAIFASQPYPNTAQAQLKLLFDTNLEKRAEFEAAIAAASLWRPELLGPAPPPPTPPPPAAPTQPPR